ncbi:MAG: CAP domain-containing protein [Sporichthyaceae bacterium]
MIRSTSYRSRAAVLALALGATVCLQAQADAAPTLTSTRTSVDSYTDAARKRAGCKPLTVDSALNLSAQRHAKDMAANRFLGHTSSNGTTWMTRIKRAGYPYPGGENVARGYTSASKVVSSWLASPSHKRNIVNCKFKRVGIGYVAAGNYWVQDFGY